MLGRTETRNGGQLLLPLCLRQPGEEAVLESQCEKVCRGRNAQGTCGPGGMQPLLDPHEQVMEAAGGKKCPHHSLHVSSDFLLGPHNGCT